LEWRGINVNDSIGKKMIEPTKEEDEVTHLDETNIRDSSKPLVSSSKKGPSELPKNPALSLAASKKGNEYIKKGQRKFE
jgi:hypothetical protein